MLILRLKLNKNEVIMQLPGGDNVGPGSDILWPELMSEEN